MNDIDIDFDVVLRRFALWGGVGLAAISIFFSYIGAEQTVNKNLIAAGASGYEGVGTAILIGFALVITLLQFVFNTNIHNLSLTLKVLGTASYVYSIGTNYLGIQTLFGFHGFVGWAIAFCMDVAPEALIAWATDSQSGDLLGNMGKFILGGKGKNQSRQNRQNHPQPNYREPRAEPFRNDVRPQPKPQKPMPKPQPKPHDNKKSLFGEEEGGDLPEWLR